MDLLQEVEQRAAAPPVRRAPASSKGWLPRMAAATNSENYQLWSCLQSHVWAPQSEILFTLKQIADEWTSKRQKEREPRRSTGAASNVHQAVLDSFCQTGAEFSGEEAGEVFLHGHIGAGVAERWDSGPRLQSLPDLPGTESCSALLSSSSDIPPGLLHFSLTSSCHLGHRGALLG